MNQNQLEIEAILFYLNAISRRFPELRFCQILQTMGINKTEVIEFEETNDIVVITDNFYEKSSDTLTNVKKQYEKLIK